MTVRDGLTGSAGRLFRVEERDQIRDRVLEMAASDRRIVAGAIVGSMALGEGDRFSDLDLTFGVADAYSMYDVLAEWTLQITQEFDAAHLFDVPSGASIYRVFLLPGCLQFDLSFSPASAFGAVGPNFQLLFGDAVAKPYLPAPSALELFGYAVHHAVRARFCIERGRHWQAEYWISSLRDYALAMACQRRGLPGSYARGFDHLPAEVLEPLQRALVASLERDELLRALNVAIDELIRESVDVRELAAKVEPQLRQLTLAWNT